MDGNQRKMIQLKSNIIVKFSKDIFNHGVRRATCRTLKIGKFFHHNRSSRICSYRSGDIWLFVLYLRCSFKIKIQANADCNQHYDDDKTFHKNFNIPPPFDFAQGKLYPLLVKERRRSPPPLQGGGWVEVLDALKCIKHPT